MLFSMPGSILTLFKFGCCRKEFFVPREKLHITSLKLNNFRAQDSSLLSFSLTNIFLGHGMKLSTDELQCIKLLVSDFLSVLLSLFPTVFFGKTHLVGNFF